MTRNRSIANARMYSVDPATSVAWRALLAWVIERAGIACEVIDYPAPLPLPQLWSRADLACAFMCGYPLSQAVPEPVVLAAPVPSLPRYAGKPMYWTDLVVRTDSAITTPADALHQRIAFTTPDSQSGYRAPLRFFLSNPTALHVIRWIGPLISPRKVVEAIVAGDADIGPVDSYALDLLRMHEPALMASLRTIASTPSTPIPPLVAAPGFDAGIAARLREVLDAVETAPELHGLRRSLLLSGFAPAFARDYDVLR